MSHIAGWNSQLDEVQAAILRGKLRHLDADNTARVRLAALYDQGLAGTGLVLPARRQDAMHVFHLYVVRSPRRDALQSFLKSQGVGTLIHYPMPVHLQPAYTGRLRSNDTLLESEQAVPKLLSLPMYPELPEADVCAVVQAVKAFESGKVQRVP